MDILYKAYLYFLLILFGACIGSFINVVIYRLPKGKFLSSKRSCCPDCGQKLKWTDLIPIISYLLLKGRCRYCNKSISSMYPIIEAISAGLTLLCFVRFGTSPMFIISFGISVILLAVSVIDSDTMEIPDSLVIASIPFAICSIWAQKEILLLERVIGLFVISVPMIIITAITYVFMKKLAFGGGDMKLMAVCGFLLGWKSVILAFYIGLLIGGGYGLYLLLSKKIKRGSHIAFGPYLCVGCFISLLYGSKIIDSYLGMFI